MIGIEGAIKETLGFFHDSVQFTTLKISTQDHIVWTDAAVGVILRLAYLKTLSVCAADMSIATFDEIAQKSMLVNLKWLSSKYLIFINLFQAADICSTILEKLKFETAFIRLEEIPLTSVENLFSITQSTHFMIELYTYFMFI